VCVLCMRALQCLRGSCGQTGVFAADSVAGDGGSRPGFCRRFFRMVLKSHGVHGINTSTSYGERALTF